MSSDLKAFVYGWGILIAFLVIRYLVRKNSEKKQRNYALNLMGLTKTSVNDQKELTIIVDRSDAPILDTGIEKSVEPLVN